MILGKYNKSSSLKFLRKSNLLTRPYLLQFLTFWLSLSTPLLLLWLQTNWLNIKEFPSKWSVVEIPQQNWWLPWWQSTTGMQAGWWLWTLAKGLDWDGFRFVVVVVTELWELLLLFQPFISEKGCTGFSVGVSVFSGGGGHVYGKCFSGDFFTEFLIF